MKKAVIRFRRGYSVTNRPPLQKMSILGAVVADRFDRATFHCFFAKRFFFWRFGLLVNVEWPPSSLRLKLAGAVSRHRSQSMHCSST